ncbi:hypothetical protein QN277_013040 [Acacia crassicarpa]|uniref:F-box domain-containing protein n=2 Tax=Acacia crassicarpa TaxID=499986 RepID=A0AAE1N2R2_9FABA|nr:hypothetical protein QN277_013040 [Acacia crassicarpa]
MKAKSRISLNNFSDAVLHHIFSFLEVKDIARLKAVSRRFQTLCVSTKQLDLIIRSSCLEDLTLKRCCGFKSVRIITDKLRTLSYTNCTGRFCDNCDFELKKDDEIVVEVSAPNLQSFMWEGPPARLCYDKVAFKSLHMATITGIVFHNLNLGEQLFEAIRWVEILSLDTLVLQYLYGMPLISFGDVRHLEIQVGRGFFYNVDDVLTNFLKRISNLDILALAPDDYYEEPDPFDFKDALMECKKTKWKKIKGLKKVKFTTGSMYFSMAFLIGMLKKSCVDMEEMTLIYPSCYHKSIERYLDCLESGSSSLSINLSPPNRKRKRC